MKATLLFLCLFSFLFSFSQDGTLDNTFGTSGKSSSGYLADFGSPNRIAVQPDGKIIQITANLINNVYQTVVLRYNANGGLDASFGTAGKFIANFPAENNVYDLVLQPDGKIVLAGYLDSAATSHFMVMRLNATGTLDATFGTNGRTLIPVAASGSTALSVTLQPDGKIVAAGYTIDFVTTFIVMFGVTRLNANGSIDQTFGTAGKVAIDPGTDGFSIGADVVVQPDGKVLVAGVATTGGFSQFAMLRLSATGVPDNTFGTGGKVSTAIGSSDANGYVVTLQPDGKILMAGSADNGVDLDFALLRYTTTGALDNTFGTGGKVTHAMGASDDEIYSIGVQTDGKIVVGGDVLASTYDIALARYSSTGVLDNTFGTAGKVIMGTLAGVDDEYGSIASQGTKIVVGILTESATGEEPILMRFNNSFAFYPQNGCSAAAPTISAGSATTICQGNAVVLTSTGTGIQWFLNGSLISGATAATYSATQAGSYTATATSGGCASGMSNAIAVTVTALPATPTISIAGNVLTSSAATGNQWYKDGSLISGATGQSYTATASGVYTTRITANGCTSVASNSITYTLTAINSVELDVKLKVSPNPVQDRLYITYNGTAKLVVEVLDVSGKHVQRRTAFTSSYELDMSAYARGSYLVRIINERTGEKVQRMIVRL